VEPTAPLLEPFGKTASEARIVSATSQDISGQPVELFLPAESDMELVAAGTLEHLAREHGYPAEAIGKMKMAVLEACLNAIEHSSSTQKPVRVQIAVMREKTTVIVENEGPTVDPQSIETPVLEKKLSQANKRGWGLKLIQKFMDRVVFEPYDRGMRLRMEKNNPAAQSVGIGTGSG